MLHPHPILPPTPEAVEMALKYADHLSSNSLLHRDLFKGNKGAPSRALRVMAPNGEHEFLTYPHAACLILAHAYSNPPAGT